MVLYSITDRLLKVGTCYEMEMDVEKIKILKN
jgi:hypothetical protein